MGSECVGERRILLHERQQNLSRFIHHLPGIAYRCRNDSDYTLEWVSDGCKTLTGYKPEDLIGNCRLTFASLIEDIDRPVVDKHIQSALREKKTFHFEHRIRTAEGQVKWVWGQGHGIYNNSGEVPFLEGLIIDITDRKKAEETLRDNEAKFRILFEWAGIGIAMVDLEGRILDTNPAFRRMLGFSQKEYSVLRSEDYTHPDDIPLERRLNKELLEGRRDCFQIEKRYIRSDGEVFWGRMFASLVRGPEGNPKFVIRMVEDITAQKRAEAALRESEGKYRLLAENITDVIWTIGDGHRVTYASPSVVKLLGYTTDEVCTKKIEELLSPTSISLVESILMEETALQRQNPHEERSRTLEVELIRKDGSLVWSEVCAKFMLNAERQITGISGVARDMTERRKVQEALRQSEARYRSFMSNFHGIAFQGDKHFNPAFMHGAVETITGYTEEEFLSGKIRWDHLVHPDDANRYFQSVRDFLNGKNVSTQREYRICRKDGEYRWVREFIQHAEEAGVFQGVIQDITEIKHSEMLLNEYRENMVQVERMASLGTIGATLAHQLNQPLTVIRLLLQQSQRALSRIKTEGLDKINDNLTDSLSEVSHAIGIINQYLTFSRALPAEKPEELDLKNIADKLVEVLSESARKAGMKLQVENMDNLPKIEGYACDLEQIFFILIQNAIQAVEKGRVCCLTISGRVCEDEVELKFADTCRGIPASDLNKIFEPFFTTKPVGQGTGLGLSILRRIISKYSGKVHVESEVGKGTTFYLGLPLRF
jgi:PAS domain S-box-containing protein